MASDFFSGTVPAFYDVPAATIQGFIGDADCTSAEVELTADGDNKTSNADINIGLAPLNSRGASYFTTDYSIPLFKGLLAQYTPDSFSFTKAIYTDGSGTETLTIIFRVVKEHTIVYCGDLSSQWP